MAETINKNKIVLFIQLLFGLGLSFLAVKESPNTGTIALVCIVLSSLFDKRLPLSLSIITSLLDCEYTTQQLFLVMLIVSISCFMIIGTMKSKLLYYYRIPVVLFLIVFILSYLFGAQPEFTIVCIILYSFIICYTIALLNNSHDKVITNALLIGGICMMGVMVEIVAQGGVIGVVRRLQYHDNIKIIATAIAFPIYYFVWELITGYGQIGVVRRLIYIVLILLCLFILILTYARGVILALALSIIAAVFLQSRKFHMIQMVFLVVLAFGGYFLINRMSVDSDIMFGNLEGGHGRTEIWSDFYAIMNNDGLIRLLFGFGPGDLKRIVPDIYAHSVVLDYFFSFGVLGFLCFMLFIGTLAKELKKRKNYYGLCLLLLCLAMYFPHGAASTTQFYYLLGLCIMGKSQIDIKNA